MIIRIKRESLEQGIIGVLVLFIMISILIGVSFTTNYVIGTPLNITNNTVIARVNVTNTEPNVTAVTVDDEDPTPASEIDLTANSVKIVTCNASVFDFNGWEDINPNATNGTLYIQSVGAAGATDNNHRYRNESCDSCRQATAAESSSPSATAYCDCKFALQYYTNDSSTWECNMTVRDFGGTANPSVEINLTASGVSSTVAVTKLLAINTSTLLDYGNLSVTETSGEIVHNVTNAGNINLNLSLRGYGGDANGENFPAGKNLTMICDFGNISEVNQKYEIGGHKSGVAFADMRNLTNVTVRNTNVTFFARTDDTTFGADRNLTLWRLQIPLSVGGICNGTIIFGAVDGEVI